MISNIPLRNFSEDNLRKRSEKAISEYKKSLTSKYKGNVGYLVSVYRIAEEYGYIGDKDKQSLYHNAWDEGIRRRREGDLRIATIGVNDYLIKHGENLEERK